MSEGRSLRWAIVGVLLATAGAYSPSLRGEFEYDDWTSIQTNWAIRGFDRFVASFSPGDLLGPARPVTEATFALDYALGGLEPTGYHLTSLAVHLATVALAFLFVLGILRRAGSPRAGPIAVLVAAAFALHPVQTESICYAAQRAEALASGLYLGALLLLVRAYDAVKGRHAAAWALAATAVAALAIGAKAIAVTLPVAFLLWAVSFGRREGDSAPLGRRAARALLLGAGAWALSLGSVAQNLARLGPGETAGLHAGDLGPWRYFLTQLRVHWGYARLLAWPSGQTIDPAFTASPSPPDAVTLAAGLASVALLVGAAWVVWRAERRPDGLPAARLIPFGIAWWYLLLAPTSSVVPIDDLAAEHRVYLASLGGILAMTVAVEALAAASRWPRRALAAAAGLGVTACIGLGVALALRAGVWRTQLSLWEDAAAKRPDSHRSVDNYAFTLHASGRWDEALRYYGRAEALARTRRQVANTARNLAVLLGKMRRWEGSLAVAEKGVAAMPGDWELRIVRADSLRRLMRLDEAFGEAKRAVMLAPGAPSAHAMLGAVLFQQGHADAALAELNRAREIDPVDRAYAEQVVQALTVLGRSSEACAAWTSAQALGGAGDPQVKAAAVRLGCRP